MAWDIFSVDNDFRVIGDLYTNTHLYLGFNGIPGATKYIQAIGSEDNIGIDFVSKGTSTLRVPLNYETLINNGRDIVNKAYVDSKIAGKDISSLVSTPTGSEDGYAIVWDQTNTEWTLSPAAGGSSYTFGSGVENDGGTVKLGGTLLTRNTTIAGVFSLSLGVSGNVLTAFSTLATTTSISTASSTISQNIGGIALSLQGGSPSSSIVFGNAGSITLTDNSTSPRGLRGGANYSANIQSNDYTQKVYVDNTLGSKLVSPLLQNPQVTENDFSVVWDNVLGRYTLKLITGGSGGGTSNSKEQQFTANGSQSVFTVSNGTISLLSFVDVNGNVQQNGVSYTRSGQDIDFGTNLPNGSIVTVHYFESLIIGSTGGGHLIYDNNTPIPQRDVLSFRNGLTATDIGGRSVVEIGGILVKDTNLLGGNHYLIGTGFSTFQFAADVVTFSSTIGTGISLQNSAVHTLVLGESGGVRLNLGSDAAGDMYYRSSGGFFTRLPIGSTGTVLRSNGIIPEWSVNTGDTIIKDEVFTANGSQSNFVVTGGTIEKINYVSVNGVIQTPTAYLVTGNTISFGVNLPSGWKVHVSYFENVAIIEYNAFNLDGGAPDTVISSPELIFDGGTV